MLVRRHPDIEVFDGAWQYTPILEIRAAIGERVIRDVAKIGFSHKLDAVLFWSLYNLMPSRRDRSRTPRLRRACDRDCGVSKHLRSTVPRRHS